MNLRTGEFLNATLTKQVFTKETHVRIQNVQIKSLEAFLTTTLSNYNERIFNAPRHFHALKVPVNHKCVTHLKVTVAKNVRNLNWYNRIVEVQKEKILKFHCMSVQYDKYIYYNQHYAHDWGG